MGASGALLRTKYVEKSGSKNPLVDPQTGEVVGYSAVFVKKTFDGASFMKVYPVGFDALLSLGKAGQAVMKAVVRMMEAKKNEKTFILTLEDAVKLAGPISAPKFYAGLNELARAGLVKRGRKRLSLIEVNPLRLWNGSKRDFTPDVTST